MRPHRGSRSLAQKNRIDQLKHRRNAIARMIALGATDKEISEHLNVSTFTVRADINKLMEELNAKNRAHVAYLVGLRQGRKWQMKRHKEIRDESR